MCGISVILDTSGDPGLHARLQAMHDVIRHRGPDGEGFFALGEGHSVSCSDRAERMQVSGYPRLGMAFRRLKICDTSAAASQPMPHRSGRFWIVFNGEVYNFRALRLALESKGHVFESQGDTEVVLAAYVQWGVDCFARFEGMWAMVILDLQTNQLVLSRDRFGIKPLYWMLDAHGALLIGSEIKQLLAANRAVAPTSNRAMVNMFLHGNRMPVLEDTFFEGIRAMPPASWCAMDLDKPGSPQFHQYWALPVATRGQNAPPYANATAQAEALLQDSVVAHLHADVPVGALLSGGLDSSTLVALAHHSGSSRLPTFSLGYRDAAPRWCEMPYVDAMVQRDAIENHETTMDGPWVAANVDRVLWSLEEPPLAMPAFAQYRVFEVCAQFGSTVILDGQGADEIIGGYQYHQQTFMRDQMRQGHVGGLMAELRAIGQREGRHAARVFASHFVRPLLRRPSPAPWIGDANVQRPAQELLECISDCKLNSSMLNRQLYQDVRWGNAKIILGYGDRNAMAHSLEARVPYFDRAFVEFMFSLPDTYKIGQGDRKRILRDIARRHVPSVITERSDRMGFGTPDEAIIRQSLREQVTSALSSPPFAHSGWVVAPAVHTFLNDFYQRKHNDFRAIWRLFMVSRWALRFGVSS